MPDLQDEGICSSIYMYTSRAYKATLENESFEPTEVEVQRFTVIWIRDALGRLWSASGGRNSFPVSSNLALSFFRNCLSQKGLGPVNVIQALGPPPQDWLVPEQTIKDIYIRWQIPLSSASENLSHSRPSGPSSWAPGDRRSPEYSSQSRSRSRSKRRTNRNRETKVAKGQSSGSAIAEKDKERMARRQRQLAKDRLASLEREEDRIRRHQKKNRGSLACASGDACAGKQTDELKELNTRNYKGWYCKSCWPILVRASKST